MLKFLTAAGETTDEVVETTQTVAEKIVEWWDKPAVQAVVIVGGLVLGGILLYQFGIKRLIRALKK